MVEISYEINIISSCTDTKDGVIEVTTGMLEEYCNVARKTLMEWERKGCPKLSRGKWDLLSVIKWRKGILSGDEDDEKSVYLRKLKADANLKERQSEKIEMELQKMRGETVDIEDVAHIIGGIIANTKKLLLAIPSKAAPRLLGVSSLDELREVLKAQGIDGGDEVSEIIEEFREAKSVMEINEVLTALVYEALEELARMNVDLFEGSQNEEEN